jgi:dephospho-CoA kinase
MPKTLRIGLTGGIASGKTTAAQRFAELGVPVIDADHASRTVVAPGTPGLDQVIARFGRAVLAPNGELDRRSLRDIIFKDAAARADLNAILHPLIRAQMQLEVAAAAGPYVVLAIPLLIEGGAQREGIDRILLIDVDEAVQIERVIARDGSTPEQARAILASQASRDARRRAADDILLNAGSVMQLRQGVERLHERYRQLAQQIQGLP